MSRPPLGGGRDTVWLTSRLDKVPGMADDMAMTFRCAKLTVSKKAPL